MGRSYDKSYEKASCEMLPFKEIIDQGRRRFGPNIWCQEKGYGVIFCFIHKG